MIAPGMVLTFEPRSDIEYVVLNLYEDGVMLERITCREEGSNRHKCGYGHFEHPQAKHLRTMDQKELSRYQNGDASCDIEKGIYRVKNNIDTLLEQPAVSENEVIRVVEIRWNEYKTPRGEQYNLEVIYQKFGKEDSGRLAFYTEDKTECICWFWNNFHKINIYQWAQEK
jgi:hypothetical protein